MSFLGFNSTYYCKGKVKKFISISNSTEQKTKESSSLTRRSLQSAAARGRVQVVQPRSEWTSSCASSDRATVPPCHRSQPPAPNDGADVPACHHVVPAPSAARPRFLASGQLSVESTTSQPATSISPTLCKSSGNLNNFQN